MQTRTLNTQNGVALITGLIFLVVLTLISLAAIRSTSLEERMAGNARDQNLAFQAAEAGVRDAMKSLGTSVPNAAGFVVGCAAGLCENDPITPVWTTITTNNDWTSSKTLAYSGTALTFNGTTPVAIQPRYIIELIVGSSIPSGESASEGGGSSGTLVSSYRVTARGWGLTDKTQATLQTTFIN